MSSIEETRAYAIGWAREYIKEPDTHEDMLGLAEAIIWYEAMLDRARRVCTAARTHVEWTRQWAVHRGSTVGIAPTMAELAAAVDALVARGEAERGG